MSTRRAAPVRVVVAVLRGARDVAPGPLRHAMRHAMLLSQAAVHDAASSVAWRVVQRRLPGEGRVGNAMQQRDECRWSAVCVVATATA